MSKWLKVIALQISMFQIACVTNRHESSFVAAEELESIVRSSLKFAEQENEPVLGLSLAIYSKGRPIFVDGFGLASKEQRIPVTKNTIFRIGSITKQFTAVGIMTLVEDRKISLSDSVQALLPEFSQIPSEVTVEHLLSHTSGIFNFTSLPNWHELESREMPRAEFVKVFLDKPVDFKPGKGFQYSNSGYYLLGLIIEKVSGMSYQNFLQQRLIKKAKLERTKYCSSSMEAPNEAKGYIFNKDAWVEAAELNMDLPYSAGGLCSTAEDLAIWATKLMRGEIISLASLRKMIDPVSGKDRKNISQIDIGWGFAKSDEMGHQLVGTDGAIDGFISTLNIYPDDDLVAVSLTNTEGNTGKMIAVSLARLALGLIGDKVIDEKRGKELEGLYLSSEHEGGFQLTWKQEQIFYTRTEMGKLVGPTLRLLSQGMDKFILNENSAIINIERYNGKATGASFSLFGSKRRFLKRQMAVQQ